MLSKFCQNHGNVTKWTALSSSNELNTTYQYCVKQFIMTFGKLPSFIGRFDVPGGRYFHLLQLFDDTLYMFTSVFLAQGVPAVCTVLRDFTSIPTLPTGGIDRVELITSSRRCFLCFGHRDWTIYLYIYH